MPEKNRTYRARIEGYTSEGLGVARIDGQAVFVHRALRGEDCDVLILKVLKNAAFGRASCTRCRLAYSSSSQNAAFGKVVQVHEPSPHRREPDCPWYGRCGGGLLQQAALHGHQLVAARLVKAHLPVSGDGVLTATCSFSRC